MLLFGSQTLSTEEAGASQVVPIHHLSNVAGHVPEKPSVPFHIQTVHSFAVLMR